MRHAPIGCVLAAMLAAGPASAQDTPPGFSGFCAIRSDQTDGLIYCHDRVDKMVAGSWLAYDAGVPVIPLGYDGPPPPRVENCILLANLRYRCVAVKNAN